MPNIKVYNMQAQEVGSLSLSEEVFGADYNEALIHEVVVAQNANARQGTKSTLTRSEVRGHNKKPWKQKHTGSARHGSTKGPQWKGGGVVFAPKPRDFSKKVNKQAKFVAFISALSTKLANQEIIVIDNFELAQPKTKEIVAFAKRFELKKRTTIVLDGKNETVLKAARNIQKLEVALAELLNVKQIVGCDKLVMSKAAILKIEEACAE